MKSKINQLIELVKSLLWILNISYSINHLKFFIRIFVTILYVVFPILSFWLLKQIIDTSLALTSTSITFIKPVLYLIAIKVFFDVGWYFLDSFLEGMFKIMRFDLELYFATKMSEKLNQMDIEFFENSRFLDLKQKALDTYSWRTTDTLNIAFWSFYNLMQIGVQSVIVVQINPIWLILLFAFQVPALVILLKIGQSAWNIWDADSATRRKFTYFSGLFENLAYIKEFKLYYVGGYFIEKIHQLMNQFHTNQKNIEKKRIIYGFGGILLSNIPALYIMVNLLIMLINKQISAGLLTFYLSNIAAFSLALSNLVKNINYGYETNLYIKEIRRFLKIKNTIVDNNPIVSEAYLKNNNKFSIEFKNISFQYPNSKRKVFSNFSLTIKPNQKIALVGENGSGKTTLIKLLCRFYDVQSGEITINGVDIKSIPQLYLYSLFSVLFQDYVGYDLTVEENIAMGAIHKLHDKRTIQQVSNMTGITKLVNSLPNKYKQLLGTTFEGGEQLSIGQWQRIALAKVFMRNSPIIILDEPTAAVDAKTENEIFNKVMVLIKNKTILMVSHRFSTVRQADEIIVLKKGHIIERGSHDLLMHSKGEYATMFNLQAKGYN